MISNIPIFHAKSELRPVMSFVVIMYIYFLVLALLQIDCIIFLKLFTKNLFQQVRLWYWLSQDSQLSVFKKTALHGSLEKLYDISGLPEMNWKKVNIPVESLAEELPFQVIIYHIYIAFKKIFYFGL